MNHENKLIAQLEQIANHWYLPLDQAQISSVISDWNNVLNHIEQILAFQVDVDQKATFHFSNPNVATDQAVVSLSYQQTLKTIQNKQANIVTHVHEV